jgi:hypothetical protein
LLVAPYADKGKDEKAGDGKNGKGKDGKLWDSSDEETSSEEDFNFISDKLKNKKELTEEEMRLLRGVLQPPFKDRKDPEYFNRMKKAQLLARGGNGDSGTEGDHGGDDFDETTLDAIRRRNKVQPMAKDDGKLGKKDRLSYEA